METTPPLAHAYDITAITDQLFIASKPRSRHVETVRGLGVDLVLSMIWFKPPQELTEPPFRLIRLPVIDNRFFPIPLAVLRTGVTAAVLTMDVGGSVLVYCRAGRHRSVAMASCILIARGMSADDAMATIVAHRPIADPHARHIEKVIRAFEVDWLQRTRPATAEVRP
jgi:protein tyrosine phosphatase (PTP) superfamily phosphohydrolase (DUF442 family)